MTENAHPEGDPLFANLRDDDPALVGAIAEARETLVHFKVALSAKRLERAVYLVKVPFVDRSDVAKSSLVGTSQVVAGNPGRPIARLWLSVNSTLDDLLFCSVIEAPRQLGLKKGDSFVIGDETVEDWMIECQGVAYGAFSLRVMRDRLDETGKRRFDEHTGIREFRQSLP